MVWAVITWVVLTRLALMGLISFATYEGMRKSKDNTVDYESKKIIETMVWGFFFLEPVLCLMIMVFGFEWLTKGLKWCAYFIGMMVSQTISIISDDEEEAEE